MANDILTSEELSDLIAIRAKPHIYAFETDTIPKYIKVGDTTQPIQDRLNQWSYHFANLVRLFPPVGKEDDGLAQVNDDIYFRDYSLHQFFEKNNPNSRLTKEALKSIVDNDVYFSNEFFSGIDVNDVYEAIEDIKNDFKSGGGVYKYYRMENRDPFTFDWKNDKDWKLRDNQALVVENFCNKVKTQKELLMYAVMRFGKSFTAMSCAKKMGYSKVLIVSAKADVAGEWKKTIQMPKCFKEYKFIYDNLLKTEPNLIQNTLDSKSGQNKVAVFLTLQNLYGRDNNGNDIKARLQQVYDTEFDLIIVDETHYGVWNTKLGGSLSKEEKEQDGEELLKNSLEYEEYLKKADEQVHGKVKLHLSGTPYNLLYEKTFNSDNIIATCQFSDILRDKEKWANDHFNDIVAGSTNPETGYPYQEYDNPYFGFPKMLRFAFNLPESARLKLSKLKADGTKWTLNDLFVVDFKRSKPHFVHEEEVLKLLKIIDGSEEDPSILSFLNIPKIKDNDVCKHMVFVLPFKNTCDAMELLLEKHKREFSNLYSSNVQIINIAGHNCPFSDSDCCEKAKALIKKCEEKHKKTISLTVNKMLTGVTVEEWDTMIMLKNTKSPQEYDQAVFRIQNQYVKDFVDDRGFVYKIDMKPQTILVDFDPLRMFELQGLATKIVKAVTDDNKNLNDSIATELNYFPIISSNGRGIVRVEPTNIVEIISNYNKDKSIIDESRSALMPESILSDDYLRDYVSKQSSESLSEPLIGSMHHGEKTSDYKEDEPTGFEQEPKDDPKTGEKHTNKKNDTESELKKKYVMCVARMLFYSFLTDSTLYGLKDLIDSLEDNENKGNNTRIFKNLDLDKTFIERLLSSLSREELFKLDEKIASANLLSKDKNFESEHAKVKNALNRLSKVSKSEVVTPEYICLKSAKMIGVDNLVEIVNRGGKILDLASKTGEFAATIYYLLIDKVEKEKLQKSIYSICTSPITYEFTRKIYEKIGIPINQIADPEFNSYSLVSETEVDSQKLGKIIRQNKVFNLIKNTDDVNNIKEEDMIKFDAIVGNPPYQEGRRTIFQYFQLIADNMSPSYSCLIYPGKRWMHMSGKGVETFGRDLIEDKKLKELLYYPNATDIFPGIGVDDGVAVVLKEYGANHETIDYSYITIDKGIEKENKKTRKRTTPKEIFVLNPDDIPVTEKIYDFVKNNHLCFLHESVTEQKYFGIESNYIETNQSELKEYKDGMKLNKNEIKVLTNDKAGSGGRTGLYIFDKQIVTKHQDNIKKWKVVVSSAHPGGQNKRNNYLEILDTKTAFGRARVALKFFDTKKEAENFQKYVKSYFVRYTLLLSDEALTSFAKLTPDFKDYSDSMTLLDFSKNIDDQLFNLFGIKEFKDYIIKVVKDSE